VFNVADVVEADEEGDDAENSEGAVDETPVRRYSTDGARNKGQRNDASAGDDAELEYPLVADGVDEGTNEGDGDDKVGESEPVGAVGHKGVGPVGTDNAFVDAAKPGVKGGLACW